MSCRRPLAWLLLVVASAAPAAADRSKLDKDGLIAEPRGPARAKHKLCCGYPLSEELGFRLTFYWVAVEDDFADQPGEVEIYTDDGFFLGEFPSDFVASLRMEGSGWLSDDRVINYAGRCRYGVGTCFETLDPEAFPYGRGAGRRPLVPFTSIAVDRRLIPLGQPLYLPEFDGMLLPDGSVHDGCVRADDTGGAIKQRLVDFFVVELENFRWVSDQLWGVRWFTPHVEDPRCEYLRGP